VVVMLGQAGSRPWITPERVALNIDDFRMPDHAGNQPQDEPIVPGGPAAYLSTLPVKAMVQAMTAEGVPAVLSNTAGTYLCNHVSYGVLHHLAVRRLATRAGFIHLPFLPEQAAGKDAQVPCLGADTMLAGLRAAVTAALAGVPALVAV
jgi:pyroglutamyl-peptidase